MSVKFQSNWTIITPKLAASHTHTNTNTHKHTQSISLEWQSKWDQVEIIGIAFISISIHVFMKKIYIAKRKLYMHGCNSKWNVDAVFDLSPDAIPCSTSPSTPPTGGSCYEIVNRGQPCPVGFHPIEIESHGEQQRVSSSQSVSGEYFNIR